MPDNKYDPHYKKDGSVNCASLRDYFAAKAMQGILSGHDADMYPVDMSYWSEISYSIADAMLKARCE